MTKIIVIDLDKLKVSTKLKKRINEGKICSLNKCDFGKKTLLKVAKGNPVYLKAHTEYEDAIFRLKNDDKALKHENRLFRKIFDEIAYFRIGVLLRREKAVKILQKLLGV